MQNNDSGVECCCKLQQIENYNITDKMLDGETASGSVEWSGPCSTQRQTRELISGPNLATGARLLSFIGLSPGLLLALLLDITP